MTLTQIVNQHTTLLGGSQLA